jgi:hypothetical protein
LCLYVESFSSKGVTWSSSKIASFLLWSRRVHPAVRRKYFISAVRSLFLSRCLIVQISLPYKRVGRADVLYSFNLVLLCTKFGFSVLFRTPVFVKILLFLNVCLSLLDMRCYSRGMFLKLLLPNKLVLEIILHLCTEGVLFAYLRVLIYVSLHVIEVGEYSTNLKLVLYSSLICLWGQK